MIDSVPLILTVDDDPHLLDIIEHHVSEWGYKHCGVENPSQMWEELEKTIPGAILLDIALGEEDGTAILCQLKERFPAVPVLMITANASIEAAVNSLKSGAYDFICKPLDFKRLHIEIDKAIKHNQLSLQVKAFQSASRRNDFHGMIGRSEPMKRVYRLIEAVASTDASVLLLGETGTGKELTARAIHECSKRNEGPFIAVNAPAIPHELIESALFGHEKGSFTGAHQRHIGYCEQANGGTLFLDEICEMNYNVQAKLLRFLQDHEVQRVGAKSSKSVDVRVIAATNRNPNKQIENSKLREDFFYRLSVVSISLASLKERDGDIGLLTRYFLDLATAKYGRGMTSISQEAMRHLETYDWPGNIRQLEHIIDQVVITNNSNELTVQMLPDEILKGRYQAASPPIGVQEVGKAKKSALSVQKMESNLIKQALELTAGSIADAAEQLGFSEATLYRKIKKYGIVRKYV
ncbi:MAG: sigma-54-dependent Fis family transcriptional regulator [Planctomycetes bacterium]|nr:sigma-54-dependent Fis family transcriptional regulator [Planctomycetota bacterium]